MTTSAHSLIFRKPTALFADARPADALRQPVAAAIFGAPLDRTTSFRSGTAGGPSGVRELSWSLESYSPILDRDVQDLALADLGDLPLEHSAMDESLGTISSAMEIAARMGHLAVMIGGEHTVSLGGYRGIHRVYPNAALIQLDAHLDLRDEYEGVPVTHATWIYHAGQEFGFENIVQLGVRSGAREEWPRARAQSAFSSPELALPHDVIDHMKDRPLYLSIDIDVLDPAFAPGTGTPEPGGYSFTELVAFLYDMQGLRVVAMDVVEVAPDLDHSGITSVAAAKLIREGVLQFGVGE